MRMLRGRRRMHNCVAEIILIGGGRTQKRKRNTDSVVGSSCVPRKAPVSELHRVNRRPRMLRRRMNSHISRLPILSKRNPITLLKPVCYNSHCASYRIEHINLTGHLGLGTVVEYEGVSVGEQEASTT